MSLAGLAYVVPMVKSVFSLHCTQQRLGEDSMSSAEGFAAKK